MKGKKKMNCTCLRSLSEIQAQIYPKNMSTPPLHPAVMYAPRFHSLNSHPVLW